MHELWDYAELKNKRRLAVSDVTLVVESLVTGQSTYYEADWERLSARQRATLQALAHSGAQTESSLAKLEKTDTLGRLDILKALRGKQCWRRIGVSCLIVFSEFGHTVAASSSSQSH